MPALEQCLALVVGALRGVGQALGRVAVHAGLAGQRPDAARLGLGEEGIDAFGMARAVARHGGGAVREREVEVACRDSPRVDGVAEAHLLGEGIAVQPVDQPLAPTRDDCGLRIVDMGIDEAGQDQRVAMVDDPCAGVGRAEPVGRTHVADHAVSDQNRTRPVMTGGRLGRAFERVALEGQRLSEKKCRLRHAACPRCRAAEH